MALSNTPRAVQARIKKLPKLVEEAAYAIRKRDANNLIQIFRTGLRDNTLRLDPLRPATIRRKVNKGYSAPRSPLYGLGLDGNRTYAKSLQAYKTKSGYTVRIKDGVHHSGKIRIKKLFFIHENGATIKRGDSVIIIPARPALKKSYQQLLKNISKNEDNGDVKKVIREYMKTGGTKELARLKRSADNSETDTNNG